MVYLMNSADEGLKELDNELKSFKTYLEDVQNKQQQRIIYSSTLKSNITATANNLANKVHVLDQKMNSTEEKQLDLTSKVSEWSLLSEENGKKISVIRTNLTDGIYRLDQKLNSSQDKQVNAESVLRKVRLSNYILFCHLYFQNSFLKACKSSMAN